MNLLILFRLLFCAQLIVFLASSIYFGFQICIKFNQSLCFSFIENDIDGDAFVLSTTEVLKTIIRRQGLFLKFEQKFKQLKEIQQQEGNGDVLKEKGASPEETGFFNDSCPYWCRKIQKAIA